MDINKSLKFFMERDQMSSVELSRISKINLATRPRRSPTVFTKLQRRRLKKFLQQGSFAINRSQASCCWPSVGEHRLHMIWCRGTSLCSQGKSNLLNMMLPYKMRFLLAKHLMASVAVLRFSHVTASSTSHSVESSSCQLPSSLTS